MKSFLKKYIRPFFKSLGIYGLAYQSYFFLISINTCIQNHILSIFKKSAPILLYHRITNLSNDPIKLAVSPESFENHLIFLKEHYDIISLTELSHRLVTGTLTGNETAITFDDGYNDNLTNALPILEKHNVPATIFITTGQLGMRAHFEWDMEYPESDRASFLNVDEIKELCKNPLITIGAHTENHARLANLSAEEQREEILKSKQTLEQITGQKIKHFAYPFGGLYDFNTMSKQLVEELGFEFAYSNTDLLCIERKDCMTIPRINIRNYDTNKLSRKIYTKSKLK